MQTQSCLRARGACLLSIALLYGACTPAQTPAPAIQSPVPLSAEDIALRTVVAIRNRDVTILPALAAESGVAIGPEESKMTVAELRAQLERRRGVYCLLMDGTCLPPAAKKDAGDRSLRGMILRQPVKLESHPLGAIPEVVEVSVVTADATRRNLFNVYVRRVRGEWRVVRIGYV
jgi:hypothetical protein